MAGDSTEQALPDERDVIVECLGRLGGKKSDTEPTRRYDPCGIWAKSEKRQMAYRLAIQLLNRWNTSRATPIFVMHEMASDEPVKQDVPVEQAAPIEEAPPLDIPEQDKSTKPTK